MTAARRLAAAALLGLLSGCSFVTFESSQGALLAGLWQSPQDPLDEYRWQVSVGDARRDLVAAMDDNKLVLFEGRNHRVVFDGGNLLGVTGVVAPGYELAVEVDKQPGSVSRLYRTAGQLRGWQTQCQLWVKLDSAARATALANSPELSGVTTLWSQQCQAGAAQQVNNWVGYRSDGTIKFFSFIISPAGEQLLAVSQAGG